MQAYPSSDAACSIRICEREPPCRGCPSLLPQGFHRVRFVSLLDILEIVVACGFVAVALVVIAVARNARYVALWRLGVVSGMIAAGGVLRGLGGGIAANAGLVWGVLFVFDEPILPPFARVEFIPPMWI